MEEHGPTIRYTDNGVLGLLHQYIFLDRVIMTCESYELPEHSASLFDLSITQAAILAVPM